MNTPDGNIPSVASEQFVQFLAQKIGIYVSEKITDFGFPGLAESLKFELYRDPVTDTMVAEIRGWLIGGKVPGDAVTKNVRWPDGVWQMFKEKYLPQWFKDRFPVRWHTETFQVVTNHYFVCPHLVTDPQGMHVKFMATGTNIASMMHPEDRRW